MKFIGKYEVLEEIDKSAVGTTYRARDNFRKRELVLKALRPLSNLDPVHKDEFCRELLFCSELTHRHLAKVLDLGEMEGGIYIATELLSGTGLQHLISQRQELALAQQLGILAQVCEGLGFAHSRGVAHGAVKPTNIVIDHNNDVTILDLGTAKWQSFILASGTRPEGLLPNYFAPEQILGQRFDSRSDLFSLALISYEFLTGRYPFQVPASLIPREIVHSDPPPVRTLNPDLPADLEELLGRMLKKNPDERLQTAEEFAAALYGTAQKIRRGSVSSPLPAAPAQDKAEPVRATTEPQVENGDTPARQQDSTASDENSGSMTAAVSSTVKTPKRENVHAGEDAAPWTARSYVASTGIRVEERGAAPPPPPVVQNTAPPINEAPVKVINEPKPAQMAPVPVSAVPVTVRSIPRARIRPSPATDKSLKRRVIAIAVGAILAIYMILNFISHQGLHASQTAVPAAAAAHPATAPVVNPNAGRALAPVENPSAVRAEPPSLADPEKTTEPAEQPFPRQQIKALWEAGNYAEALRLVDDFLVNSPANGEARTWKKRIRAAQEAEAAIK